MPAIAKVTTKGQVTLPKEVRDTMHVSAGSLLEWEIMNDGSAVMRVVQPLDASYLKVLETTLSEWSGAQNEKAYRNL